jgi:hypothetical protein
MSVHTAAAASGGPSNEVHRLSGSSQPVTQVSSLGFSQLGSAAQPPGPHTTNPRSILVPFSPWGTPLQGWGGGDSGGKDKGQR